jgi:tRNA-modifying protein YgfZ
VSSSEIRAQVELLRGRGGAVRTTRDVVRADGAAVIDYLQGQLSQDVAALPVGASAWSFVLQPQGKVDVWFRITRTGDAEVVLDTDAGWGEALVARLERFKLRTAAAFEVRSWQVVALRGAAIQQPPAPDGGLVVAVDRPGERGWDLLGPAVAPPASLPECDPAALEVLRIESGTPRMGAELDGSTIPAESGVVPVSVSFTKGCYTGQELVARVDSRGGNVPRRLHGVVVTGEELPPAGAKVRFGDRDAGELTSVARSPERGAPVALAYVGRAVTAPADVTVAWEGGSAPARVEALPLVS